LESIQGQLRPKRETGSVEKELGSHLLDILLLRSRLIIHYVDLAEPHLKDVDVPEDARVQVLLPEPDGDLAGDGGGIIEQHEVLHQAVTFVIGSFGGKRKSGQAAGLVELRPPLDLEVDLELGWTLVVLVVVGTTFLERPHVILEGFELSREEVELAPVILEIVVEAVVLEILADYDILAEFLDDLIAYPVVGADVGKLLDPAVDRAFRDLDLETPVDMFDRLLNGVAEVVIREGGSNNLRLVGFIGKSFLPEFLPAILAEVDLAGPVFEAGGSLLDDLFTAAGWTCGWDFHRIPGIEDTISATFWTG